jgi:hypothetical protein
VETIVAEEPVPVGQDVIKEEAVAEGGPPLVPHSMLLRSLSGAKQPTVVGDSSPSRVGDGAATTRTTDEADGKLIYFSVSFPIYLHEQSDFSKKLYTSFYMQVGK